MRLLVYLSRFACNCPEPSLTVSPVLFPTWNIFIGRRQGVSQDLVS